MHNNSDQNRAWRTALRALQEAEANNARANSPNFVQNQDNAGTGTDTVTVTTAGITKKGSGKMKITSSIAGESTGPGTMTATLLRDATPIGHTQAVTALSANDDFSLSPCFVDTAPDGAAHTYTLSVTASAGNITCAAGSAQIVVEEI